MISLLQRGFLIFLTFFMMIFGVFTGVNNFDTVKKYEDTVNSIEFFDNNMESAVPQTEVCRIIKEHFNSPLPAGKTEKKVLVLGYDGCRVDNFSLIGDAENSAIKTLINDGGNAVIAYCGGVNFPKFNKQATSTAPGWCSMLTGVWADVHGITDNGIPKSNDHLTILTTLVEDGTIDDSAFYVSWGGHFNSETSTYWNEKQYVEEKGIDTTFLHNGDDDGTYNAIISDLSKPDCTDFIFSIFEFCDHAGHTTGFNLKNPDYTEGFASAEAYAKKCIDKVKARETYDEEDWLILITTDHGGYNLAHGFFTRQERMTFIVANKQISYDFPTNNGGC